MATHLFHGILKMTEHMKALWFGPGRVETGAKQMICNQPFTGPDEDGFYWMEWTDETGVNRVIIGETLEAAWARYRRIMERSDDPGLTIH